MRKQLVVGDRQVGETCKIGVAGQSSDPSKIAGPKPVRAAAGFIVSLQSRSTITDHHAFCNYWIWGVLGNSCPSQLVC